MKMDFLLQKICSFCSNKQLKLFEKYLLEKKQKLAASLINCLIKNPEKELLFYCKKIYGSDSESDLKKFNQLNHHTLHYFSFISQYFPTFLQNNMHEIDELLFNEDYEKAATRLNHLFIVASKIEDYYTLNQICERVENNSFLSKIFPKKITPEKKQDFINNFYIIENLINEQNRLSQKSISEKKVLTDENLFFFTSHFSSKEKSVKIIAQQSYLNLKSIYNDPTFYSNETLDLIKQTKKLIDKYPFLLIAKHKEKLMSIDYMLIKHTRLGMDEKGLKKSCNSIIDKWQKFHHTNNQLDSGLMLALSIKASYYITDYYYEEISYKLKKEIIDIINLLNELENTVNWDKTNYLKLINFYNVKAMFLVLANEEKISIKIIEKILHEYQQKPFQKMYDGLFVVLLMAYFQAKDYDAVVDSFNRYKKLSKSYVSVEENDVVIRGIYYAAQLSINKKNQYQNKLNDVLNILKNNKQMKSNLQLINRIKQSIS